MDFRYYQELPHKHTHYCPACQLELQSSSQNNQTDVDTKELECTNDNCPVLVCYCNGLLSNYSVTIDEALRCVKDILSVTGTSPNEVFDSELKTISDIGTELRTHLDTIRSDLSIEKEIAAEKRFEAFAKLERTLARRDYSGTRQVTGTGEKVLNFNGVYIPHSEVLVYTVMTTEFDDPRMIHYPIENATYLDKEDTEPFEQNISKN